MRIGTLALFLADPLALPAQGILVAGNKPANNSECLTHGAYFNVNLSVQFKMVNNSPPVFA